MESPHFRDQSPFEATGYLDHLSRTKEVKKSLRNPVNSRMVSDHEYSLRHRHVFSVSEHDSVALISKSDQPPTPLRGSKRSSTGKNVKNSYLTQIKQLREDNTKVKDELIMSRLEVQKCKKQMLAMQEKVLKFRKA